MDKRTNGIFFVYYLVVKKIRKSQKISKKIPFLSFVFFNFPKKKKCYTLSFSILGGRNSTRALQYSPFQISGGCSTSLTKDGQTNKRKSSCLILDNALQSFRSTPILPGGKWLHEAWDFSSYHLDLIAISEFFPGNLCLFYSLNL